MYNSRFPKLTLRLAFGNLLSYIKSTLATKQRKILTAGFGVCLSMQLVGFSIFTMSRRDLKDIIFLTDNMDEAFLYGRRTQQHAVVLFCTPHTLGQGKKPDQGNFLVEM